MLDGWLAQVEMPSLHTPPAGAHLDLSKEKALEQLESLDKEVRALRVLHALHAGCRVLSGQASQGCLGIGDGVQRQWGQREIGGPWCGSRLLWWRGGQARQGQVRRAAAQRKTPPSGSLEIAAGGWRQGTVGMAGGGSGSRFGTARRVLTGGHAPTGACVCGLPRQELYTRTS